MRKPKRKLTPIELRLQAIEMRLSTIEQDTRDIPCQLAAFSRVANKVMSDYQGVGELAEIVAKLDMGLFSVFSTSQNLIDMLKKLPPMTVTIPEKDTI